MATNFRNSWGRAIIAGFFGWLLGLSTNFLFSDYNETEPSPLHQTRNIDISTQQSNGLAHRPDQKSSTAAQSDPRPDDPDRFMSIPIEFAPQLKIHVTIPMSDELNRDAFKSLGLSNKQTDEIAASFAAAIEQIKVIETKILSTEMQDDHTVILKFPASDPQLAKVFAEFKQSIASTIPDGRAEIIFQNLMDSESIGYSQDKRKEIKTIWSYLPTGELVPSILDDRIGLNTEVGVETTVGAGLTPAYFIDRYGKILDEQKIELQNGLIRKLN